MENKYNIKKKKQVSKEQIESHMDFNAILSQAQLPAEGASPKRKIITLISSAVVTTAAAGLFLFFFKNTVEDLEYIQQQHGTVAQLETPFKPIDVSYLEQEYVVSGTTDTIHFSSGSLLIIPNNTFVDEQGAPVEGNVKLTYRELNTNKEMIIAGVVKESSQHTNFQSAGMIEIKGHKDGKPIYFNEGHEIEIQLHSVLDHQFVDENYLSYHFQDQQWLQQGADRIEKVKKDLSDHDFDALLDKIEEQEMASKPVEPIKPGDVPPSYQVFDFDFNKADYSALESLSEDIEFLVKKKDLQQDPFTVEWHNIDIRKSRENEFEVLLNQVNDQGNISRSQTLTIYPYNAYSKTAQKEYEKRLDKYNQDRDFWHENITNLALAMVGSSNKDQIVNYFTIDRFGLWNCAREISKEIMTDQISDFIFNNDSFEPVRIYVFNDRHSVYMSKDTDIYNDHYQIDDADTQILARDKDGNMFVCHQKETEPDGFKLFFEPVTGVTREELDKVFNKVG